MKQRIPSSACLLLAFWSRALDRRPPDARPVPPALRAGARRALGLALAAAGLALDCAVRVGAAAAAILDICREGCNFPCLHKRKGWGDMRKILLAMLVLLAVPASASAATITVNDTTDAALESGASTCESTDAGKCTLRAAIQLADREGGETTIDLPEGVYGETESPYTLDVDAEVTIDGAGAEKTMVSGEGEHRVFEVQEGGILTLEGVTVEKGDSYDEPDVGGGYGGGVNVWPDATLVVRHSRLVENLAEYEGGAIYAGVDSSVVVEESTIEHNGAGNLGGGIDVETAYFCGEAYAARHDAAARVDTGLKGFSGSLTVSRSTISDNTVEEGDGGGVAVSPYFCDLSEAASAKARPSLVDEESSAVSIEQSTIAGNRAETGDSDYVGYGGGVFEDNYDVPDPIIDSTIADNFATEAGGGVYVEEGGEDLVSDTVADNTITPIEQIQARHAAKSAKADYAEGEEPPGANLATYTDYEIPGWIELRNTIVAEETGSEFNNCSGYVESMIEGQGYNLDYPSGELEGSSYDSCGMSMGENDLVGVDPKLDPNGLQQNGGATETIALPADSPAIGYVPVKEDCEDEGTGPALELESGKSSPVDQRSEPRPGIAGDGCDIGAYEYQEPAKEPETKSETKTVAKTEVLAVKVTSVAQCTSKRDIVIHIQNVKQFGIVSAVVSIDGKAKRTLRGRSLRTAIDLVGLPKGTFTVEIKAKTRKGQTLHGQRVYHTCHTKLPGHLHLRL